MNKRGLIQALVAKDFNLYFNNRFFAMITVVGLVFYIAAYYLMPKTVDETLEMAIYADQLPQALSQGLEEEEGLVLELMPSEEAVKQAVADGDFQVGVALPDDMAAQIAAGEKPLVKLYFAVALPPEFQDLYAIFIRELAFLMGGQPLNIETQSEVIGPDLAGAQIPPRERMLPLLAVFILVMETMGLASLISSEVETGTIRALLVTRADTTDLFTSKGILGTGLAFVQVVLLMLVTGGFSEQPLLILTALLLGSLLVCGLGFLVGSISHDLMSAISWGMLVIIVLAIPALTVLLPGFITSGWIRLIPSYYLVDTVH